MKYNADEFDRLRELLADCYHKDTPVRLASGTLSSEYVDAKYVLMDFVGLSLACGWVEQFLVSKYLGGPSIPAALIVGGVLARRRLSYHHLYGFVIREKPKGHGMDKVIEGVIPPRGSQVLLIEDVITTGQSVLTAARIIEKTGCTVGAICALVDRQAGGVAELQAAGYVVHTFTTLDELRQLAAK